MRELSETSFVAVTTDHWTSIATRGYLTVTAHCISNEWELQSYILETARMEKATTGVNIAEELGRIIRDFDIEEKVSAIVSDNTSNMTVAIEKLDKNQARRFAHILNLIVQEAIKKCPEIDQMKTKVKSIVTFFNHSTKATDLLNKEQSKRQEEENKSLDKEHQKQIKPIKLIQEVATRWNSTFEMFERYLRLHQDVTVALVKCNKKNLCLEDTDVEIIESAIKTLTIFKRFTAEMSSESLTTMAKIIPMIKIIRVDLLKSDTDLSGKLQSEMEKRWPNPEQEQLWAASTLLDPRFKQHCFSSKTALTKATTALKSVLRDTPEQPQPTLTEEETVSHNDDPWQSFDIQISTHMDTKHIARDEMERLQAEAPIKRQSDPLKWWKLNAVFYPQLAIEAKRYLCIPATSVPSERLFSKAGELVSKKRNALSDGSINKILFLNKNMKI